MVDSNRSWLGKLALFLLVEEVEIERINGKLTAKNKEFLNEPNLDRFFCFPVINRKNYSITCWQAALFNLSWFHIDNRPEIMYCISVHKLRRQIWLYKQHTPKPEQIWLLY